LVAADAGGQVVYRYQGRPFKFCSCGLNEEGATVACPDAPAPGNPLTSYIATDAVTAVLSFDAPLPANLPLQDVGSRPGFQLVMNDGRHSMTSASSGALQNAEVATDEVGQIVAWQLRFTVFTSPTVISEIQTANDGIFVEDEGELACCGPFVQGDRPAPGAPRPPARSS
jgi:hypothetical protein